jgi:hypothetical protein
MPAAIFMHPGQGVNRNPRRDAAFAARRPHRVARAVAVDMVRGCRVRSRGTDRTMLATVLVLALGLGATDSTLEAPPLPQGAVALDEPGRYRLSRSFDEVLDFYQRSFNQPGVVRWRNVVNLPGIRAKHLESLRKKSRWEGINIYEYKGETRLFVIPRDARKASGGDKPS